MSNFVSLADGVRMDPNGDRIITKIFCFSSVVTRSRIAVSCEPTKTKIFMSHEVHEAKTHIFLRVLRGENMSFSYALFWASEVLFSRHRPKRVSVQLFKSL
jgi:hypothetical protein